VKRIVRLLLFFVVTCALEGCAFMSNARDYATLVLYAAEHKQLVFVRSPCGGLVAEWVREKNFNRLVVVCSKPDCSDCKLKVRR
jgi:hypothetical protein